MATVEDLKKEKRKRNHLLRTILEELDSMLEDAIKFTKGEPLEFNKESSTVEPS